MTISGDREEKVTTIDIFWLETPLSILLSTPTCISLYFKSEKQQIQSLQLRSHQSPFWLSTFLKLFPMKPFLDSYPILVLPLFVLVPVEGIQVHVNWIFSSFSVYILNKIINGHRACVYLLWRFNINTQTKLHHLEPKP